MRFGNPALSTNTFADFRANVGARERELNSVMTVQGTVNKTGFLLILCAATYALAWNMVLQRGVEIVPIFMGVGFIGGLIAALITIFFKKASPFTAPVYALLEGLGLGAISIMFEQRFPGIPMWAVVGTFAVLFSMLTLYKLKIIRVTERFRTVIMVAMMGIVLLYMAQFILGFFNTGIPLVFGSGWVGIGVSIAIVGVASFSLAHDFDFIEKGAEAKAPKYMEWYGAFGVMLGLVWRYLELLKLLSKLSSRD